MGQKTHPTGFRLGVIRGWDSKWFEEKNYANWLHEDLALRGWVKKKHASAGIAKVEIERAAQKVKVNIFTARPGIVIGKKVRALSSSKKSYRNSLKMRFESISKKFEKLKQTLNWLPKISQLNLNVVSHFDEL